MSTSAATVGLRRVDVTVAATPAPAGGPKGSRRVAWACGCAVLMFAALQCAVWHVVQAPHNRLRDPIYHEKLTLLKGWPEFFETGGTLHRMLWIGSSRTQLLVDTAALSDARTTHFNFGCAGCGPVTHALYYRRLLEDGFRCETLVLELHPAMLADTDPPFEHKWLHTHRLHWNEVEYLRGLGWGLPTPPQFRPGAELQAISTYRMNLLDATAPVLLPSPFGLGMLKVTDGRGFVRGITVPDADRWKFVAQARADYAEAFDATASTGPAWNAIEDIITLARPRCHVVLFQTPEAALYRQWYKPEYWASYVAKREAIRRKYDLRMIDAHDWLDEAGFADGHHANPAGTVRFRERLRQNGGVP